MFDCRTYFVDAAGGPYYEIRYKGDNNTILLYDDMIINPSIQENEQYIAYIDFELGNNDTVKLYDLSNLTCSEDICLTNGR